MQMAFFFLFLVAEWAFFRLKTVQGEDWLDVHGETASKFFWFLRRRLVGGNCNSDEVTEW